MAKAHKKKTLSDAAIHIGEIAGKATIKAKKVSDGFQQRIVDAIDNNGIFDVEKLILLSMKIPGVRIQRSVFLNKTLFKDYPQEVIDDAISFNPAHAGISLDEIDRIADHVIRFERNCVSGLATALGVPGGVAMAATIPADIIQYYGYMMRAAQKLLYLYGFPELNITEGESQLDAEILNILTICLGVMYGVAGAKTALVNVAKALAVGVEKQLLKKALTKGAIYPIVKNVAKWFGMKMTKEVFAGFFKKAIPVVGGVAGGAITYLSFKPCCDKLKDTLRDTRLSNPSKPEESPIIIDVEDYEEL